jgi:hypothetical protein
LTGAIGKAREEERDPALAHIPEPLPPSDPAPEIPEPLQGAPESDPEPVWTQTDIEDVPGVKRSLYLIEYSGSLVRVREALFQLGKFPTRRAIPPGDPTSGKSGGGRNHQPDHGLGPSSFRARSSWRCQYPRCSGVRPAMSRFWAKYPSSPTSFARRSHFARCFSTRLRQRTEQ